jgi:predicted transcriptional regulator
VLNQLEKAGLVESSTDKTQPGRPRKVYRIRSQVATTA